VHPISSRVVLGALGLSALLSAKIALAGLPLEYFPERTWAEGAGWPASLHNAGQGRVSLLVQHPPAVRAQASGLWPLLPGISRFEGSFEELSSRLRANPGFRFEWAPRRRLLLDAVEPTLMARLGRLETGLSGQGVLIAIVDSGVDFRHPDLRYPDGSTRIVRWLDLSLGPLGAQPELEAKYGCNEGTGCAVLTATEINAMLGGPPTASEPTDLVGHGTHVASLAAGGGNADARYVGVAPQAELIIVRATRSFGFGVLDADIVRGSQFAFLEAEALGRPVVLNLSLGSDVGPHDGSTLLERALAELVGPEHPGRGMVVAAGNSGGVLTGLTELYPPPFGIHTNAHVAEGLGALLPVLSPPTQGAETRGEILIWLSFSRGSAIAVGLRDREGAWVKPVPPGQSGVFTKERLEASIFNASGMGVEWLPAPQAGTALVALSGAWRSGSVIGLELEGRGHVRAWLESSGDLLPGPGNPGALFANAQVEGTVGIPATHPELLAVGASVHRTGWRDYEGNLVSTELLGFGSRPAGATALFSAAGPSELGDVKPEVVAPGLALVGALSSAADPRNPRSFSMFQQQGGCGPALNQCLVVSDGYAVATGTSLSAPLVAGAMALLLEREPRLTQPELRGRLLAGTRRLGDAGSFAQRSGGGRLDISRLLAPAHLDQPPVASESWLTFAGSFARPEPTARLALVAHLKGTSGQAVDPQGVSLAVRRGTILEPMERLGPGVWQGAVAASPGSAGERLEVSLLVANRQLLQASIPIAVDSTAARYPLVAKGGCAVVGLAADQGRRAGDLGASLVLGGVLLLRLLARRRPNQSPCRAPLSAYGPIPASRLLFSGSITPVSGEQGWV
jgi:subtilisin family serine protease